MKNTAENAAWLTLFLATLLFTGLYIEKTVPKMMNAILFLIMGAMTIIVIQYFLTKLWELILQ